MLRTRLYLGLLPLLLLIVATGGYAIHVCRDLAASYSRDLINNYRAVIGCQQMRDSARLMLTEDRKTFEDNRRAFIRELAAQRATSNGSSRADLLGSLERTFTQFATQAEAQ